MIPAVIYARYSSTNQREESIDGQLRDCHRYAELHGFNVVKEYTDSAISGRSDDRPAFQRMIRESESGAFQAVLVWKLDRFARNRYDSAVYKSKLKKNGVKIYSVMESIGDGPEGIILEGLMESLAEYYSANLSENIKRGCYDSALKRKVFGKPPLGYRKGQDGRYEIDPETAPIVRKIFQDYAAGKPISEIKDELNAAGIRTSKGRAFTDNSFHRMFQNEKYIGVYEYKDIRDENGIPPIIDQSLWDSVQLMIQKIRPRRRHQKANRSPEVYLLTTKLYCGHCFSPMTGESAKSKTGEIYRYYSCNGVKSRNRNSCKKKRVPKDWIENEVIRILSTEILTDEFIEYLADEYMKAQREDKTSAQIASCKRQLADVNKRIENINNAIANGIWSSSTRDMLIDLETQRDQLTETISALNVRPPEVPRETVLAYLQEVRSGSDDDLRSAMIDIFVRRIYLKDTDDGHMAILFELSMDGSGQDPVNKEFIIDFFEQTFQNSTCSSLNELRIIDRNTVLILKVMRAQRSPR